MKKLMIAAAIVCAAAVTQAATFNWKTNARGGAVVGPDGKTMTASTAYIFNGMSSAADIVSNWAAGQTWTTGNLDSREITSAGGIAVKSAGFEVGEKGSAANFDGFFAFSEIIDGKEYLYISSEASKSGSATGTTGITFTESQSPAVFDAAKGYQGAGWYTAAAVPEPTSGLLLLLGVAGMALRRRRA